MMFRSLAAETLGTFWLVFAGCGSAVLTGPISPLGIGYLGTALAFGLSMLTMSYALGHVSGAHFNPAVTVGLAVAGRFEARLIAPYVLAQVLGGALGAVVLYAIASGKPGFDVIANGFVANGYGDHSPGQYSLQAAFICEFVMTAGFVGVFLGATHPRAPAGFAPLAIGLALALVYLVSAPVTNASVNPARSMGPALVMGGPAVDQLWLFWAAPLAGAVGAALLYRCFAVMYADDINADLAHVAASEQD